MASPTPVAVAVLDDYQGVARSLGPWERVTGRAELVVFHDHVDSDQELAARLARRGRHLARPHALVRALRRHDRARAISLGKAG